MKNILVIMFLCCCVIVSAQCPDFTDLADPVVTCQYGTFSNPFQYTGIIPGRHTIITEPGTDPNTGNQLPLLPPGENTVVKLGNDNVGSEAEAITYSITVNPDYSILQVKFAVVFQDPGHPYDLQPRFMVRVLDSSGELIDSCAQYFVAAASSLSGFNSYQGVRYRPWGVMSIDLSDFGGQQVQLQFATFDCGWQGHYGYAYFTASCVSNTLTINNVTGNQITVSAPEGFPSYQWSNGSHTNTATYTLNPGGTSVSCNIITNTRCKFTLSGFFASDAGAPASSATYYDTICEGEGYDQHYFHLPPQYKLGNHTYRNTFLNPDPNGEEIVITLHLTIMKRYHHLYQTICYGSDYQENGFNIILPHIGKHTDSLVIPTDGLCDSILVLHLTVSPPFELPAAITGNPTVCESEELVYAWPDAFGLDTVCWTVPAGVVPLSGLCGSSLQVYFTADAPNPALLSVSGLNGCGSGTLSVSVTHYPSYHNLVQDTICAGSEYHLHGFHLARQDSAGLFTYTDSRTTIHGCDSVTVLRLLVAKNPGLTTLTFKEDICVGESTVIHAMGHNSGIDEHGCYVPPVAIGDILCSDSSIVKPAEWPVAGKTAIGVVFYVDNTDMHGWAINLFERDSIPWCTNSQGYDIPGLDNYGPSSSPFYDLDGYNNTQIIRAEGDSTWFPAAYAVDFNNGWYLPAIGQLMFMYGHYPILNQTLSLINGTLFLLESDDGYKTTYWSSTEYDYYSVYILVRTGTAQTSTKLVGSSLWPTHHYLIRSVRNF